MSIVEHQVFHFIPFNCMKVPNKPEIPKKTLQQKILRKVSRIGKNIQKSVEFLVNWLCGCKKRFSLLFAYLPSISFQVEAYPEPVRYWERVPDGRLLEQTEENQKYFIDITHEGWVYSFCYSLWEINEGLTCLMVGIKFVETSTQMGK